MSLKGALTTPKMGRGGIRKTYIKYFEELEKNPVDYKGIWYKSLDNLARDYGLNTEDIKIRIYHGFSLEETLELGNEQSNKALKQITICDHEGQIFNTLDDMIGYYKISKYTYYKGIREGKNLKEILVKERWKRAKYIIEGKELTSLKSIAEHYNISEGTLYSRLKRGLALEEAVKIKTELGRPIAVKDFNGKEFKSKKEMAKYYGKNANTIGCRLKKGGCRGRIVVDHKGKEYPTIKALAKAYEIPDNILASRLRNNWDMEEALTIPVGKKQRSVK